MDRIKVDTRYLEDCVRLLEDCRDVLSDIRTDVQRSCDSMPDNCQRLFGEKIRQIKRGLSNMCDECEDTVSSIHKASELFEECEDSVLRSISGISTSAASPSSENASVSGSSSGQQNNIWNSPWLSWLDSTLDFFNICEYSRDYEDPGAEAERARDELMQQEMSEVFQDEELNEAAWNKASAEEKKEILNKILARLNEIQGTNVKTKINYFDEQPDSAGRVTLGYYRDSTKSVHVNTYMLNNYSYSYIMDTVAHEMRHAYQHAAVKDPDSFTVSESTLKSWDNNFDNYISYDQKKNNFQQYRDQPVESDARGYAGEVDYI